MRVFDFQRVDSTPIFSPTLSESAQNSSLVTKHEHNVKHLPPARTDRPDPLPGWLRGETMPPPVGKADARSVVSDAKHSFVVQVE